MKKTNKALPVTRAATTTLIGVLGTSGADAIVHFDNSNAFSAGFGDTSNIPWNIDGIGGNEIQFSVTNGTQTIYLNNAANAFGALLSPSGITMPNRATSYVVGPSVTGPFNTGFAMLRSNSAYDIGGFADNVAGYFGFRFTPNATTLYGWASITFEFGPGGGLTVNEWAYEQTGAPIQVGAVPEPAVAAAGLGALALGAAGLRRWRKSKTKKV